MKQTMNIQDLDYLTIDKSTTCHNLAGGQILKFCPGMLKEVFNKFDIMHLCSSNGHNVL